MNPHASEDAIRRKWLWSFLLALVMPLLMLAQVDAEPVTASTPSVASDSLYARLGGGPGVQKIVHELIGLSAADPVTRRSFARFNRPRLEKLLEQQICQLAGGGCRYEGDSMKQSHAGLDITEAEFYGMVEHLRHVCDRQGIDQRSKNELLALLAPMKRDIVTH